MRIIVDTYFSCLVRTDFSDSLNKLQKCEHVNGSRLHDRRKLLKTAFYLFNWNPKFCTFLEIFNDFIEIGVVGYIKSCSLKCSLWVN